MIINDSPVPYTLDQIKRSIESCIESDMDELIWKHSARNLIRVLKLILLKKMNGRRTIYKRHPRYKHRNVIRLPKWTVREIENIKLSGDEMEECIEMLRRHYCGVIDRLCDGKPFVDMW